MLGLRTTIYIIGTSYTAQATMQLGAAQFTLTSDHAVVMGGDPIFASSNGTTSAITLRSVTLGVSGTSAKSLALSGSTITLQDVAIEQPFQVGGTASLVVIGSTVDATGTSSASTQIERSVVHAGITVTAGTLRYNSNQFQANAGVAVNMTSSGEDVQIVDSVFVTNGTGSVINTAGFAQIDFCTFVTTQSSSIPAIACAGPDVGSVSSSIDAWNALAGGCNVSHSLFAGTSAPSGTANQAGPVANFFIDLAGGNYRPSAISLARGQGDPTVPGSDHDITGASRPANPDEGAYEVP